MVMAAVRTPPTELTPVQRLVLDAVNRMEREWKGPKKFSLRPLELARGIPNGTIGKLSKGQSKSVTPPVAKKVAALLGIAWEKLIDEGESSPAEPSATPPPATTVRMVVVNDEHRRALSEVFDGSRHRLEDADAVRELLARKAALIEDPASEKKLLLAWLDSAARLRVRGHEATPEAIFADVTLISLERLARLNEAAAAESAERGYVAPAEVPAALRGLAKTKAPRD